MICGNTQIIDISFITWRACEDLNGTIEIAETCHCHEFGTYNLNITHQSWLGVNFVMWPWVHRASLFFTVLDKKFPGLSIQGKLYIINYCVKIEKRQLYIFTLYDYCTM